MKIAYFSPLPPLRTGIADYSVELLKVLQQYAQIDLFIDNFRVSEYISNNFQIYSIQNFKQIIKQKNYDAIIYHIGNNEVYHGTIYKTALENPGIIVLHDFAIHHLLAQLTYSKGLKDKYIEEMYYNNGQEGQKIAIDFINGLIQPPWSGDNAIKFPMNRRLIDTAKGIIVHSIFSRQKVKKIRKNVPVKVIYHHSLNICESEEKEKIDSRIRLDIDLDLFLLASFGFINSSKRIDKVLSALKKIKETCNKKIKYILVGEQNEAEYPLEKLIKELGLQDIVEFTGFTEKNTYIDLMKAADICINLRYPYYGETSGNLHRMLGFGKTVLVTDIGSFSEYPDDVVLKVNLINEEEQIYDILNNLIINNELRSSYSRNALEFAKTHCHINNSAKEYINFIEAINSNYYNAESLIEDIAQCFVEIGIDEDNKELIKKISEEVIQITC